jgi:4-hydroxy 2-oxovalerate aldolase
MSVEILDTTLRDGSYVIDFQFDGDDTALLVSELSHARIPYIEIGHGLGLGAGRRPEMRAAVTDQQYLDAAALAAGDSRWGVFFIPGIGDMDDIRRAAESGMSFIRIGTDITDVQRAEPYVHLARTLQLEVFCNFMKTYAVEPTKTAQTAKMAVSMGSHHVCVVDSAGGMLPSEVTAHVEAIREIGEISVGFHGHNNLGLAIANGLAAVEAGASIIDTSIRGMGRSAGNASTEIFALALHRAGHDVQVDVHHVLDTAERIIDPLLRSYQQMDSLGVISGYAQFHSSFTEKVSQVAEEFDVDVRDLIVELTKVNRVSAPDELLQEIAAGLAKRPKRTDVRAGIHLPNLLIPNAESSQSQLDEVLARCQSLSKKWKKLSVMNIVRSDSNDVEDLSSPIDVSPYIFEGPQFSIASAKVSSRELMEEALVASLDKVDYVLVDQDRLSEGDSLFGLTLAGVAQRDRIIEYSDTEIWSRATVRMTRAIMSARGLSRIVLVGRSLLAEMIATQLKLYTTSVSFVDKKHEKLEGPGTIVLLCSLPEKNVLAGLQDSVVLDVQLNSLTADEISSLHVRQNQVLRIEMHRELHAEIQAQLESSNRYLSRSADSEISGIRVVSNGLVGQAGDLVVDSVSAPTKVIGVADGRGLLLPLEAYDSADFRRVQQVREFITSSFKQA